MIKRLTAICTLAALAAAAPASPPPAIPATPAPVEALLYAQPFCLEQGYEYSWRAERPVVVEGYILVLQVNPDFVYPRQVAYPVLYVGDQTAERVNIGYESGRVIAIVPEKVDLSRVPIWFGTPNLPDQVDAETISAEQAKAATAGIEPFGSKAVDASLRAGGEEMTFADQADLLRHIATLIRKYSPEEKVLADSLLMIGR